jgi:hypothetical protein
MLLLNVVSSLRRSTLKNVFSSEPRSRKLVQNHLRWGTEPLEIRRLLTGDVEFVLQTAGAFVRDSAVDSSGNSYIAGSFSGVVDFDPGPGIQNRIAAGTSDLFVVKYSPSGALIWARTLNTGNSPPVEGLDVDEAGGVYVTGKFSGTRDLNPGTVVFSLTALGIRDFYILKLNAAGNFEWARQIGIAEVGQSPELHVSGISVSPAGDARLFGYFYGTLDFDPGAGVANLQTPSTSTADFFLLALNSSGNYQWARQMRGSGEATAIEVDSDGTAHLTGSFGGTLTTSSSSTTYTPNTSITSIGSQDGFVSRFMRDGTEDWTMRFGGPGYDRPSGIAVSDAHGISVVGRFENESLFGTHRLLTSGRSGFIARIDAFGQPLWARELDANPEQGNGFLGNLSHVAFSSSGQIFVGGTARGTVDLDPGVGVYPIVSAAEYEAFVSVLDSNGDFQWGRATRTTGNAHVRGITPTSTGEVLITGTFVGNGDFDGGPGVLNLNGGGTYQWKLTPDFLYTMPTTFSGELVLRKHGNLLELRNGQQPGATLLDAQSLDDIRTVRIQVREVGVDRIIVDFSAGGFTIPGGVSIIGGGDLNDTLEFIGTGGEAFTYASSILSSEAGRMTAWRTNIDFRRIAEVFVRRTNSLFVETQGVADVVTLIPGTGMSPAVATQIVGTSSLLPIVPITFTEVTQLTIETGTNDQQASVSADAITFQPGSLEPNGLQNIFVRTGKGNDTLTVNSADLSLPVPDGVFWFVGGTGTDRLNVTGDAHWHINDIRLVSSVGGRIQHDVIERTVITGGALVNNISAEGFNGDATLDGHGGNDLIRGGNGNDILYGGIGNDRLFGGAGDDTLYGQDGNDLMYGEDGDDVLRGSAGNDRMFGDQGEDWMYGDGGNDWLAGGEGDDVLVGGAGIDLYDLQGTGAGEELQLQQVNATSAVFRRKPRGLINALELDSIFTDVADEFFVSALGGDDVVAIDLAFTQLGSVDGGDGADSCTAPAAWIKVNC